VLASIITSLIVFSVINNMFYHYEGSAIYALPLIGGFGVILSTIYKSMGKFNYAVFISNLWKIGLVFGVILHILNDSIQYLLILIAFTTLGYAILLVQIRPRIRILLDSVFENHNLNSLLKCFVTYILGVLIVMFLANADRFIIISKSPSEFTNYFLFITYLFVPLTILSSTFGTIWASEERVKKHQYSPIKIWVISGITGLFLVSIGNFILMNIFELRTSMQVSEHFLILLLLVVKFKYLCSTALTIFTLDINTLLRINLMFVFLLIIFSPLIYLFKDSTLGLLTLLIAFWYTRTYLLLRKTV